MNLNRTFLRAFVGPTLFEWLFLVGRFNNSQLQGEESVIVGLI